LTLWIIRPTTSGSRADVDIDLQLGPGSVSIARCNYTRKLAVSQVRAKSRPPAGREATTKVNGVTFEAREQILADKEGSVLHQQALTALGFFMGLTLTSLVLILNAPGPFHTPLGPLTGDQYFQIIVTYVAMVGGVSSVGLLCFLEVGGGLSEKGGFVDKLGTVLFFLSVFGFMGALPLLLSPFTKYGAAVVLVVEVLLAGVYFIGRRISDASVHGGAFARK